ncbi:MAG TPA: hypothetical protein VKY85_20600 [Candidatus Angelobacter sp.]|nr:hypothetical protein [Candidatus Angelobacter sp.]
MTVRLLAYGGTQFEERIRIGAWPAIPLGTLGDFYGLTSGSLSFGVGILAGEPFLIARTRQNIDARGGYPFSLLVDPGEKAWKRHQWNGARMIAGLLTDEMRLLWEHPEECTPECLEQWFSALSPRGPSAQESSLLLSQWMAGSMSWPDPVSIAPRDIDRLDRPEPLWMAGVMETLPVALRNGHGWLIGGGSAHARALGARLVLDDEGQGSPDDIQECLRTGERVIEVIATIQSHDASLLAPYLGSPAWQWPQPSPQVLEQAGLLANVLKSTSEDEEVFDKVALLPAQHLFLEPARQAALALAASSGGALSRRRSEFLLQAALAGDASLGPQTLSRMDEGLVLDSLRRHGHPPDPWPPSVKLPARLAVRAWATHFGEAQKDAPALLNRALQQLPNLENSQIDELVQAAISSTAGQGYSQWSRVRLLPVAAGRVRDILKAQVARRLGDLKSGFDPRDYLLFAQDEGMEELGRRLGDIEPPYERPSLVSNWISAWLDMLSEEERRDAVETCFRQIAVGSFRRCIPIPAKIKIAEAMEERGGSETPWRRFQLLSAMFEGREGDCRRPAPDLEKPFLQEELQQLFSTMSPPAVPKLRALRTCLGEFSAATRDKILSFKLPLNDPRSRDRWLGELKGAGLEKETQAEGLALLLEAPEQCSRKLKDFPEVLLRQQIRDLLFSAERPLHAPQQIANLLGDWGDSHPEIKKIMTEEFQDSISTRREQLARCWSSESYIPAALAEVLPDQSDQIVQILAMDKSSFEKRFMVPVDSAVRYNKQPDVPLVIAVIRYLVGREGESLRKEWARRLLGNQSGSFEQKLKKLLSKRSNPS